MDLVPNSPVHITPPCSESPHRKIEASIGKDFALGCTVFWFLVLVVVLLTSYVGL